MKEIVSNLLAAGWSHGFATESGKDVLLLRAPRGVSGAEIFRTAEDLLGQGINVFVVYNEGIIFRDLPYTGAQHQYYGPDEIQKLLR